jgi:hypothetical protein
VDPLERFEFSQSSLQDFIDCRRRFQLRYLQRVAWPAVQAEPARENERHIQRGERFHRLAQQYLLGVPEEKLTRMAEADEDENLRRWWQNFLDEIPAGLDGTRFVEVALEVPLGPFRLVAKYDLVLLRPDGRAVIYDWKTSTSRPSRAWLLERLQTRVYPYLLVQAGASLHPGMRVEPEQVTMIYWFTEPGQQSETLAYDTTRCGSDAEYLLELVSQIRALRPQEYTQSESEKACGYCVYRSLCRRGVRAGDISAAEAAGYDPEEMGGSNLDLEQIGEISF